MGPVLHVDFETRSRADLKKIGAYRYAADPSTEATMASYAVDHGPVNQWEAGQVPTWMNYAADPHVTIVAHNAEFEREILRSCFGLTVPPERFRCTAAQSARHGIPRNLDGACDTMHLEHQKDARGKRLVQKFAKPRRASAENADEYWTAETAPEDYDDFLSYNLGDTAAMQELFYTLPQMSDVEQRLWAMTVRMNERGVAVDTDAIPDAVYVASAATARLAARFEELTGTKPFSPKARAALGMESLAKADVRHALRRTDLTPTVREALLIRKQIAKASVKKLNALLARVSEDGRLRGSMIYGGAERTQRWSGGGVQLHNLPRGLGKHTDAAFAALSEMQLDVLYADPILTVSEMIKGFLTGPFLIGDFAQIEARALAWLARQLDLVQAFAADKDIYCELASDIYGRPIGKYDDTHDPNDYDAALHIAKRQLGKIAVLGCGYGLGAKKFVTTLDTQFDVVIDSSLAEHVVASYRERYAQIPKFWGLLERGLAHVVRYGSRRVKVGPVFMGVTTIGKMQFAHIELPSGRSIYYAEPKVAMEDPDLPGCERGFIGPTSVSYLGRDLHRGGKWGRVSTYGGKITENVVQALARDMLADAMIRLEDEGFDLRFTVHDEVVAEGQKAWLPDFDRVMNAVPAFTPGFPHKAETFWSRRYRK